MAYDANFASTPRATATVLTGAANTSRAATSVTTGIVSLLVAGASGSRVDDLTIIPNATISAGTIIRFWLFDGTTHTVFKEVSISAITLTTTNTPVETRLTNLAWIIPTGYTLKASNNTAEAVAVVITRAGDF